MSSYPSPRRIWLELSYQPVTKYIKVHPQPYTFGVVVMEVARHHYKNINPYSD